MRCMRYSLCSLFEVIILLLKAHATISPMKPPDDFPWAIQQISNCILNCRLYQCHCRNSYRSITCCDDGDALVECVWPRTLYALLRLAVSLRSGVNNNVIVRLYQTLTVVIIPKYEYVVSTSKLSIIVYTLCTMKI